MGRRAPELGGGGINHDSHDALKQFQTVFTVIFDFLQVCEVAVLQVYVMVILIQVSASSPGIAAAVEQAGLRGPLL